MKFGVLFMPQDPPKGEKLHKRWQEILTAAEVAEESGFEGVFLPEHHMMDDGYVPQPIAACAALAARTSKVDVGTTVSLLPFYNPVHVAEMSAVVDVVSGGRMRLGCGLANFEPEFELFGLEKKKQVSRFEESIDLVQRLWAGEELDHDGKNFKAQGKIRPLPLNAELWLGAMSEPGVDRAAKFGCPWVTDPLHNIEVMTHWTEHYQNAGEKYQTTSDQRVIMIREGWCADSLAQAKKDWWPCIRADHWFYFQQVPRWVADREPFLKDVRKEEDFKFENHRMDRLVVGSPQDCIETIEKFRDAIDPDYMIMRFRLATGPSHRKELECIRRFGSEVIPHFQKSTRGSKAKASR